MRLIGYCTLFLASVLVFTACKKNSSSSNPCKPESFETFFQTNKTIDTVSVNSNPAMDPKPISYEIKSGNNLLFTFTHQYSDCPDIMDDEGKRTVLIEVPAGANSFSITNNETECKVLMINSCFCYNGYPHMISRSTITGRKLAFNRWEVEAKLFSDPSQTTPVYFKKTFTLKN